MKKLILSCTMLCAIGVMNASEQSIKKATYWGEEANESIKNPCKGELLKICAVIEYEISPPSILDDPNIPAVNSMSQTSVKTTVKDADGNILHEQEDIYACDSETVSRMIADEAIRNGASVEFGQ